MPSFHFLPYSRLPEGMLSALKSPISHAFSHSPTSFYCSLQAKEPWHIFHSQKIHWRFSGWIIQKSSSQMFPTSAYLRITGQSSQDIKHSYHPWEDTAWEGSGQSAQPCAGPLTEGDGARASERVGFYIPDEPHHRWAVTCSFALWLCTEAAASPAIATALQLCKETRENLLCFLKHLSRLAFLSKRSELLFWCSGRGNAAIWDSWCKSRVAPFTSTNWMGDGTCAPRQTLESRKARVAIHKKRTALVTLLSNFFSWASPIGTLRGANPAQSNSCPL